MISQINIISVVDVIGALSSGSLKNNLFMMDNRRTSGLSAGVGTDALTTHATHAQVLNWHVTGIDFQTDVQIKRITFYRNGAAITAKDSPCVRLQKYGAPSGHYWAGVINYASVVQPGDYQYLIEFDMGGRTFTPEAFSLIRITA